jgi:hypothetical protein
MKTGSDLHLDPITDEIVQENAGIAAARGAALLDKRRPGWFDAITDRILPENAPDTPMLATQLGLMPSQDEAPHSERKVALEAFTEAQEGEEPLFTSGFADKGEKLGAMLEAMLGLRGLAIQETFGDDVPRIDLAAHGFVTEFPVLGLGRGGGYIPTPEDEARDGFCIDKAAEFLADAWNTEINARREVKR